MNNLIKIPDDILYLIHITQNENTDNWEQINIHQEDSSQYPGAYFTLITKDNRLTEKLYPGKFCLIFSRNLLKQSNYHINISDDNGRITQNNTYFSWNLEEAVDKIRENSYLCGKEEENSWKINDKCMNEVVFHDPVSMDYLCMTIKKGFDNSFLPDFPIENKKSGGKNIFKFKKHKFKTKLKKVKGKHKTKKKYRNRNLSKKMI